MKLAELITTTKNILQDKTEDYAIEAEQIISYVTGFSEVDLIRFSDDSIEQANVNAALQFAKERASGIPLAYVLGEKFFYKNKFFVEPGVLIPRSETELIVEEVVRLAEKKNLQILDIGCGSGCLGLSIALELKNSFVTLVDRSPVACSVTIKNQRELNVKNSKVIQTDFLKYPSDAKMLFDIIVANPPYIDKQDPSVSPEVFKHEPHEALFAEQDGYKDIFEWSQKAYAMINVGGYLLVECGWKQSQNVILQFKKIGFNDVRVIKDYQNIERIIVGKRGV